VKGRIEAHATAQLRDRLDAAGISDVEETGTDTLSVAGGHEANLIELQGNYPVSDITFPVQEGSTITIEGGALPIEALLAVWAADGNYLIAGGAFPAANFTRETESALSDAISVSVDVDLGLTPDAYREELLGLVTAVR
jgi:hypothetical protein